MSSFLSVLSRLLYQLYETIIRGRNTFAYYKEYKGNQRLSAAEIDVLCFSKIKKLLIYCYKNIPYYQQEWDRLSIDVASFQSFKDIEKLPFLTKEIINNNYSDLKSPFYINDSYIKTTGGSSGVPLKFEFSRESNDRRTAVAWRGYEWAGACLGDKTLYLWGGNPTPVPLSGKIKDAIFNFVLRRKMLNSFDMREDNLDYYISSINKYKPKVIVAYTTPLFTLAEYIISHDIEIWNGVETVLSAAEALFPFQAEVIEKAFKANIHNTYGGREVMLMASECKARDGLHLTRDHLYLEVVSHEGVNLPTVQGEVVVTDLHNYAMPLIRYKNGDLATYGANSCSCELPFPILTAINGRVLATIKTKNGITLPGEYFPHLIKDFEDISAYQVVQDSLELIELRIKLKNGVENSNQVDLLKKIIQERLDNQVDVKLTYVKELEKTSIGKTLPVISRLIQ